MSDKWLTNLQSIRGRRVAAERGGFGRNVEPIRAARQHRLEGTRPWGRKRPRSFFRMALVVTVLLGFATPFAVHHLDVVDLRASGTRIATVAASPVSRSASPTTARTIPICSGRVRHHCLVDGDTGWHEGEKWRLVARSGGVDAPETERAECAAERAAGDRATRGLLTLMSGGYTLSGSDYDSHGRRLVAVTLSDGRDAGEVLMENGLAQTWPNRGNRWCE